MCLSKPAWKLFFTAMLMVCAASCDRGRVEQSKTIDPATLNKDRIKPCDANPRYWQYKGTPVILIGGSRTNRLFHVNDLGSHLDNMEEVGANYVRVTMKYRRDEPVNQPFLKTARGYDLKQWDEQYWELFDDMLRMTYEREIIVQLELWGFHDFFGGWEDNAWNPKNNINYDTLSCSLQAGSYGSYWTRVHDFFHTVPAVNNDTVVLHHQKRFVDKILEYTFRYNHVLYCITNEIFTQYSPEWGWYWAGFLRDRAGQKGVDIEIAEMYQNHDLTHQQHKASLDHPGIYSYIDISQNSRKQNQEHWDNLQYVWQYISDHPRPINHTKTYGGMRGDWTDGPNHGLERAWRNLFGGAAATRYHRPPSGIGLNERAQAHIRSMRMLLDEIDLIEYRRDVHSALLSSREPDEAYLVHRAPEKYAVYFPDGGEVVLDLTGSPGTYQLRWLNVEGNNWVRESEAEGGKPVTIRAPFGGHWVGLLVKVN